MRSCVKMLLALRRQKQKDLSAIKAALRALASTSRVSMPSRRTVTTRRKLPGARESLTRLALVPALHVHPNHWTARDNSLLRRLYPVRDTREIAAELGLSFEAVRSRAKVLRLRKEKARKHWTAAENRQLRELYPDTSTAELVAIFHASVLSVYQHAAKIGAKKSAAYLENARRESGLQVSQSEAGIRHRFTKGIIPANKGTRRPGWFAGRMRETQFRKGQEPFNTMPLWSFRWYSGGTTSGVGYLVLKTGAPGPKPINGWEFVHKLIWEQANGPLPDWKVARIWWKDGDHANCSLSNLELVTAEEHMARTTIHTLPKPLVEVIQLRGALTRKLRRLTHGQKHTEGSAGSPVRDAGGSEGASRQAG